MPPQPMELCCQRQQLLLSSPKAIWSEVRGQSVSKMSLDQFFFRKEHLPNQGTPRPLLDHSLGGALAASWMAIRSCYTDPWLYKLGLGTCNVTSIVGIVDIAMLSSGYCGFADCSVSAMLKTLFTDATVVQSNNGDIWT